MVFSKHKYVCVVCMRRAFVYLLFLILFSNFRYVLNESVGLNTQIYHTHIYFIWFCGVHISKMIAKPINFNIFFWSVHGFCYNFNWPLRWYSKANLIWIVGHIKYCKYCQLNRDVWLFFWIFFWPDSASEICHLANFFDRTLFTHFVVQTKH